MEKELAYHWRVMRSERPDLFEPSYEWRQNLNNNPIIPQKYKQLMMVAMACTIRYSLGIQTHARMAIEAGATKEELYAAVAQTMTIGGIPAYRTGMETLKDYFGEY